LAKILDFKMIEDKIKVILFIVEHEFDHDYYMDEFFERFFINYFYKQTKKGAYEEETFKIITSRIKIM
jgi:hypothetical protein